MTNADMIRSMTDDELVDLLVWGVVPRSVGMEVPDCDDGCENYRSGCANGCPHDKRERNVRNWLRKEAL